MPTFKFDDREIPFEPGDTIIEATNRRGIDIPHYCWHPGLKVAANCRMCLVEVEPPPGRPPMLLDVLRWDPEQRQYVPEKKPKLIPACQMQVADGMVVWSDQSEHVRKARAAVQEMLLLNHPVDCPICDQAGECRLQDYWQEHQQSAKRMLDPPVHKPKATRFGPNIVYDGERCILCTRCVRFCRDVAGDPVLSKRERGNLSEITLSQGRQLDHPYSLMTAEVCPVGALTSDDFRFQRRVWFLRSARTICPGCATGCNAYLDYDPRNQQVVRHRPRENLAVNQYWMCDEGMLSYRRVHDRRVLRALVEGKRKSVSKAVAAAARLLHGIDPARLGVVLSAQHSNEDNFALLKLARDGLGATELFLSGKPAGEGDELLRHPDKNPNTAGATALCGSVAPKPFDQLASAAASGQLSHVLALGGDVERPELAEQLRQLDVLVLLATHQTPLWEQANVVLPACTWAEAGGTYVNARGLVQRSMRAIAPLGRAEPAWQLVAELGRRLEQQIPWKTLKDLRNAMQSEPGSLAVAGSAADPAAGASA